MKLEPEVNILLTDAEYQRILYLIDNTPKPTEAILATAERCRQATKKVK
jgi:uncharacterized protein (DUF1778 family)